MGGLISRLRAKPSTKELLEDLEKEIESLEEYKRSTEQQHKRIVGSFIFYFILTFILGAGVFLVYYFPHLTTTKEKLIYSIPLWIVPLVCFLVKKFLHWYFIQKIKYNDENLSELKRRRRSLLEFAMETETYKVVKELLEKYDPEYHKKVFETRAIEAPPPAIPMRGNFPGMELRKRASPVKSSALPHMAPGQTITLNTGAGPPPSFTSLLGKPTTNPTSYPPPFLARNNPQFVRPPVPQPMPRPVLPRDRTVIDRIVDYMVGDGPSNRYALICRQCQSHNGMALQEEFQYIAFRCCYCFHWNPPRTQKQLIQGSPPPQDDLSPRLALQDAGSSSPLVTEPHSGSDGSCSSDERDSDDSHKQSKGRQSPRSGSESPSLRRRLIMGSENEIHARLEEDKPNHLHAELD